MDNLPRITIVMPSYNQSQYIEESILSILDQNYPNLEFMIYDGGSTDGSKEIIESYSQFLAYWRSQPDKGQTEVLIQGFNRAKGDLLGWVNSDDILFPGCLNSIAQVYNSHPEGGLFGGNFVLIDSAGQVIRYKRYPSSAAWFVKYGSYAICQPGSFFKRKDYLAVGGLHQDLIYTMDADLYVRMLLNGTRFFHTGTYLAGFRKHSTAKTVADARKAQEEIRIVRHNYWPTIINRTRTRIFGAIIYIAYQILSGNYLRMTIESLFAHGHRWRDLFSSNSRHLLIS
jgi:glycosyltransferase involved in cell wall biosynthesis